MFVRSVPPPPLSAVVCFVCECFCSNSAVPMRCVQELPNTRHDIQTIFDRKTPKPKVAEKERYINRQSAKSNCNLNRRKTDGVWINNSESVFIGVTHPQQLPPSHPHLLILMICRYHHMQIDTDRTQRPPNSRSLQPISQRFCCLLSITTPQHNTQHKQSVSQCMTAGWLLDGCWTGGAVRCGAVQWTDRNKPLN